MSITRKELADIFTGIWYEDDDETTAESHLRMVDAAIAALDAADKITPELPAPWQPMDTLPDVNHETVWIAFDEGEVYPRAYTSREFDADEGRIAWCTYTPPAHPSQHQENPQ